MKRYIRLKERINRTSLHSPSENYQKLRPTLSSQSFFEYTNENNFLSNEVEIQSKNLVFLIGGSFIENLYCQNNKRISSTMAKQFALNNYDLNVINSGVSGSTSLNSANLILNKIIKFKPKHIILFIPTNDAACLTLEGGLWNESKNYSNLLGIQHKELTSNKSITEKIDSICKIYTIINTLCKEFNTGLTVSTSPLIDKKIDNFYLINKESHIKISEYRNKLFDKVLQHCINLNIETIDLRINFSNKHEYFFDDVHTNEVGSSEIGKYLFTKLQNKFINFKKENVQIYQQQLIDEIDLSNKVFWLPPIPVEIQTKKLATISFFVECSELIEQNNALFCVKFEEKTYNINETGLVVSPAVGSYRYILTKNSSKYHISYDFKIPEEVNEITIGYRLWNTESKIKLRNIKIYIQDID